MHPNYEQPEKHRPTPWGFWATLGFCCIIAAVYLFITVIVIVGFVVRAKLQTADLDILEFIQSLPLNGLVLAISICASAPFVIGLIILFAKIRKGITIRQYLCLNRIRWKDVFAWSLAAFLFAGCWDAVAALTQRPIISEFMVRTYNTACFLPLLWLAVVAIAPVYEELLFRGFLFTGIANSRIGSVGAVILTSMAWAATHSQYDIYNLTGIFAVGLLLGYARLKSNSVYAPISIHVIINAIATIEVALST